MKDDLSAMRPYPLIHNQFVTTTLPILGDSFYYIRSITFSDRVRHVQIVQAGGVREGRLVEEKPV